jgi:hypothetical protein
MRFGVATFVTDEGIAPARLGGELEQRDFESGSSPNTPTSP